MTTNALSAPRWYDTAQAAAYLGLTPRQVARARQAGKLGCTRMGNAVRHTQEQLDAYIAACTVAPSADAK